MNANAEFLREWDASQANAERARKLYPHSAELQTAWLRAVEVVRSTTRGWVLDTFAQRLPEIGK